MRKCQQSGGNQQHDSDNQQAGTEDFLDCVFKKHSDNKHWNHRDEDIDGVFCAVVEVFI